MEDVGTIRDIAVGFLTSPWGWVTLAAVAVFVVYVIRRR